jgi:acetate---CoA ligase (ADP-forming)
MNSLLEPQSIAIIGASNTPGKVGHDITKNLLTQGYKGAVYPINPKSNTIVNTTAYPSIIDVPSTVDLAIIVIPAPYVPKVVEQCIAKKVPNIMVISAGFSEVHTEQGKALEQSIVDLVSNSNSKPT